MKALEGKPQIEASRRMISDWIKLGPCRQAFQKVPYSPVYMVTEGLHFERIPLHPENAIAV